MYNAHRGMVPAPNARLTELFDQLRQEYENQSRSTGEFEHQRMSPSPSTVVLAAPNFPFLRQWRCATVLASRKC
jgi:hypothetical protein